MFLEILPVSLVRVGMRAHPFRFFFLAFSDWSRLGDIRFCIPIDLRCLEKMCPLQYLRFAQARMRILWFLEVILELTIKCSSI